MFKIKILQLKKMLPLLEEHYGFKLYDITEELSETYERQKQEGRYNSELADTYSYNSKGHKTIRVTDYVMATDDFIKISVSTDFKKRAEDIVSLCKKELKDNYQECARALVFMASIQNRNANFPTSRYITGEQNWNINNYTKFIRPELLQLYIARNSNNGQYHKACSITFGNNNIQIQNEFPWFEKMLDRYLHRYLGIQNVKEAKLELASVYGKKVGNPLNEEIATYIWGTYHLLQALTIMVSKKAKTCSRPQSRFIAEFLNIIGMIDIYITDSEAIRSRMNSYLAKFDSLKELLDKRDYRTSPNNSNHLELY